jgi:hypothetical protein
MPRGLPQIVKEHIEKCRSSALAAVDSYNRPGPRFRTAQFVILIIVAWTAFFHAIFYRRGRRPWFRRQSPGGHGRYVRIDGEPKHWDLGECLKQYFGDRQPPERKNLEFLIGLRNKIEHRHLPGLDPALYGECQSYAESTKHRSARRPSGDPARSVDPPQRLMPRQTNDSCRPTPMIRRACPERAQRAEGGCRE